MGSEGALSWGTFLYNVCLCNLRFKVRSKKNDDAEMISNYPLFPAPSASNCYEVDGGIL